MDYKSLKSLKFGQVMNWKTLDFLMFHFLVLLLTTTQASGPDRTFQSFPTAKTSIDKCYETEDRRFMSLLTRKL